MFTYDPINEGLEFLANRDLEKAESLFLRVMNDPYAQQDELSQARAYLNDIRACQSGAAILDFDHYKKIVKKPSTSLEAINDLLTKIYFSSAQGYSEVDEILEKKSRSMMLLPVTNFLSKLKKRVPV